MTAEDRIGQLKKEFEKGQLELAKLEQRRQEVCATMLRISGAIQVLQEMEEGQRQDAIAASPCAALSCAR
jgi:hypothetical protein